MSDEITKDDLLHAAQMLHPEAWDPETVYEPYHGANADEIRDSEQHRALNAAREAMEISRRTP